MSNHTFRYIFETKEIKKIESKGKKDKDGKSEKVLEQQTIARLQVGIFLFAFCLLTISKLNVYWVLIIHCILVWYLVVFYTFQFPLFLVFIAFLVCISYNSGMIPQVVSLYYVLD